MVDKCTGAQAFFMGSGSDEEAYWSVRCTNGAEYQVQIKADAAGAGTVLECGVLKTVSGIECFKSLSRQ